MRVEEKLRRSELRARRRLEKVEREFAQFQVGAQQTIAYYEARLALVETNSGKLVELERVVAALTARVDGHALDDKRHTGK